MILVRVVRQVVRKAHDVRGKRLIDGLKMQLKIERRERVQGGIYTHGSN